MVSTEQQLLESHQQQLASVDQMVARYELNEALQLLACLARQEHPSLESIRQTAQQLIPQLKEEQAEHQRQAQVHLGRARVLLDALRYNDAVAELGKIPIPLRDREMQKVLAQVEEKLKRINDLKCQLRAETGVSFADRLACIEQLLKLQPDDPQVNRWASQVHDHVIVTAQKCLQAFRYRDAVDLLKGIPAKVRSEKSGKLLRHAGELAHLESETKCAPYINAVTLDAAQRLVRLDPQNHAAQTTLKEMTRRYQAAGPAAAQRMVPWTPCPDSNPWHMPVEAYRVPLRLEFADKTDEKLFHRYPGQFFVASGLALQAIGQAAVPTNLRPSERGVLGKLRSGLRTKTAKTGWGLDLSNTGLKAVQLSVTDDQQIQVTASIYIPHRLNLSVSEAADVQKAIILESLAQFSQDYPVKSADQIVTQWPSLRSLTRFPTLPPAEGKKLRELVEREALQQIPFPATEVVRDSHCFARDESDQASYQQPVLILAARLKDVEERLALFRESGIEPQTLQCDAVALHNFLHYDLHTLRNDSTQIESTEKETTQQIGTDVGQTTRAQGVVVLDCGADATGIVVSLPQLLWFRATRPAGNDLANALARRFKITTEMAEQVRRDPRKVKRLGDLHDEMSIVFHKMAAQMETALSDFEKLHPHSRLGRLLVTGGVGQTHGLLRYLRFGR